MTADDPNFCITSGKNLSFGPNSSDRNPLPKTHRNHRSRKNYYSFVDKSSHISSVTLQKIALQANLSLSDHNTAAKNMRHLSRLYFTFYPLSCALIMSLKESKSRYSPLSDGSTWIITETLNVVKFCKINQ